MIYNTSSIQSYTSLHPKLPFVHTYPGFVRTPIVSSSSSTLLSLAAPLFTGLTYPFFTSAEGCAEYMRHALLTVKDCFSRLNQKGDGVGMKQYSGNEAQRQKFWEHTKEMTSVKGDTQ